MGIGMLRRHYNAAPVVPAIPEDPTDDLTVDQLREFARKHDIGLGGAKKKADILDAIADELALRRADEEAPEEAEAEEGGEDDDAGDDAAEEGDDDEGGE